MFTLAIYTYTKHMRKIDNKKYLQIFQIKGNSQLAVKPIKLLLLSLEGIFWYLRKETAQC